MEEESKSREKKKARILQEKIRISHRVAVSFAEKLWEEEGS